MRKIQLLGITVVAVLALSALGASSALAAFSAAEWLEAGNKFGTPLAATTVGSLTLENVNLKWSVLCAGSFDGRVGPGSADEVTEVLNTNGIKIEELAEEKATNGLSCTGVDTCETGSEVWPLNMPWKSEVQTELTAKTFYDLLKRNTKELVPAYFILCLVLGGMLSVEELCVTVEGSGIQVANVTNGVEPTGSFEPLGSCAGVTEVSLITADAGGLVTMNNKEALTVSE